MSTPQKSIIFDLGAVMVDWNPQAIAQNYTSNNKLQKSIVNELFHHSRWINFDNGLITENEVIVEASKQLGLSNTDVTQLMHNAKESLHVKQDTLELLQLAKHQGLKTYCLSNLSHEWFAYLSQRYDFFNIFDGKVISAQEGIGKPELKIYQCLIERYKLDTSNTLFIDDRAENTQAAQVLGIKTVTFQNSIENLEAIKAFIFE